MNRLTEIYNQIMTGLKEQGEPSIGESSITGSTICFYRLGKNGKTLKCAAGQIIPDDKYSPQMENISFDGVNIKFNLGFSAAEANLISILQRMHDQIAFAELPSGGCSTKEGAQECLEIAQTMVDMSKVTITELPFK